MGKIPKAMLTGIMGLGSPTHLESSMWKKDVIEYAQNAFLLTKTPRQYVV